MERVSTVPLNTNEPIRYPSIICDNGSYTLKAGFAGDDFPRTVIPTLVGTSLRNETMPSNQRSVSYVGQLAKLNEGILDTVCPMRNGVVHDWDAMEKVWFHMYFENLMVPPENFNILHTESFLNTMESREKLVEIMFELFNVPKTAIILNSILPLYSNGKTNGLVIDSGYDYTHVVPILYGNAMPHAVRSIPLGGSHVTQYLKQLINERGYDFSTPVDIENVRSIKEKFCYCSVDFEEEQSLFNEEMDHEYKLPDGRMFRVSNETFRSPEILFNPALFNIRTRLAGIHKAVHAACTACQVHDQPILYKNMVLAGGNTLFPFLSQRLENMVSKLTPPNTEIQTIANPERTFSTWIGGSILASLPTFDPLWITSEEYREFGKQVVYHKN